MANGRPKKRKKVRYSEIRIRLSYKQKRSLINYCHARQTTPNKLIKKMIRKYISNFADDVPEEYYVTENQLDMFEDMEEEIGVEFMDDQEEDENENENNEHGIDNMEEEDESQITNIEYQISSNKSTVSDIGSQVSNIESEDSGPETPPTLF